MNTITGKLKDKVDVKYDRKAYELSFSGPLGWSESDRESLIFKLEKEMEKLVT